MTLSNAERQRRYRQRLKVRAAIVPGAGLYEAAVEHLRTRAEADGMVSRGYGRLKREQRQRMSPEALAAEICEKVLEHVHNILETVPYSLRLDHPLDEGAAEPAMRVRVCLEKIEATLAPPKVTTPPRLTSRTHRAQHDLARKRTGQTC